MGRDANYDVILRGEVREYLTPGRWVFIQRAKEYGGGFWLGKAYDDCFWLEFDRPTSLSDGLDYIIASERVYAAANTFDDDFHLV
ncbi:Uncharacterised protein [Enterobacter cancerogenus]|uniref:LF-82 n=1 Tax=Enterobacter cancerogenus TaxID=69218 RepID=A0A484XRC9_9ENTR|nr:Uncharacterised protein [Enterobacter cancerogenus]